MQISPRLLRRLLPVTTAIDCALTLLGYDRIMFRYSSLFRSRWLALFWSVGILWSAVSFVGSEEPSQDVAANGATDDGAADLNELQALVGKLKSS